MGTLALGHFLIFVSFNKGGKVQIHLHFFQIDAAMNKLSSHVSYILEYLIRFVVRLKPGLDRDKVESLLMRFVASLTHQSVTINGINYPHAKLKFPKLRGGTADSTLKFMLKLMDWIENGPVNSEEEDDDDLNERDETKYGQLNFNRLNNQLKNGQNETNRRLDMDIDGESMRVSRSRQSSAAITIKHT